MSEHVPAPPQTIGHSTGLVYCKVCCYLLGSDAKGRTATADKECIGPVPITLRHRPTPPAWPPSARHPHRPRDRNKRELTAGRSV